MYIVKRNIEIFDSGGNKLGLTAQTLGVDGNFYNAPLEALEFESAGVAYEFLTANFNRSDLGNGGGGLNLGVYIAYRGENQQTE